MSSHPLTNASALLSIHAILLNSDQLVLAEMLLALEKFQVQLAVVRTLQAEYQKVVQREGDAFMNLFKAEPTPAASAMQLLTENARTIAKLRSTSQERWPSLKGEADIESAASQVKVLWKQQQEILFQVLESSFGQGTVRVIANAIRDVNYHGSVGSYRLLRPRAAWWALFQTNGGRTRWTRTRRSG